MRPTLWLALIGGGGMVSGLNVCAQRQDSLAGQRAMEQQKRSIDPKEYNFRTGPVRWKADASFGVSYTDNVFYSHNREADVLLNPELNLGALWPVSDLNALRLSLGLGYERYLKNDSLSGDAPLVNPGSELVFNIFAGAFRIQLHERFSYQESLFFESFPGEEGRFYNLNDVGTFARLDNEVGFQVDWDLNRVILTAGYNHENFISITDSFDYLDRASEWFTGRAAFPFGDGLQTGLEVQGSLHNYDQETVMNDHQRARVGPFVEVKMLERIRFRAGGGYDMARYDEDAGNSEYDDAYGYARITQETRLFSHTLAGGREHLLGDNANNLRTTFVRYSILSPVVAHMELEARLSVNFAKEFGGDYQEEFTYYGAACRAGSQFHKRWRADLGYEFRLKNADVDARDFHRNRVTLSSTYSF